MFDAWTVVLACTRHMSRTTEEMVQPCLIYRYAVSLVLTGWAALPSKLAVVASAGLRVPPPELQVSTPAHTNEPMD